MNLSAVKFAKSILKGNKIEMIPALRHHPAHTGRIIRAKEGTLLKKLGIESIYSDKLGSFSPEHTFTGDRFICVTGKKGSTTMRIRKDSYNKDFLKLGEFFDNLLKYEK